MPLKRTKSKPVGVGAVVGIDAYRVIVRAVEEGVAHGWRRAHKHTDEPDEDSACEAIVRGVIDELCEWLCFEATHD